MLLGLIKSCVALRVYDLSTFTVSFEKCQYIQSVDATSNFPSTNLCKFSHQAVPQSLSPSFVGPKGRHSVYHGFQFPREADKIDELVTFLLAFRSPHDCHQLALLKLARKLLFFCVLMTRSVYRPWSI